MFDFSSTLNLPVIFGGVIALAIFMYILLDGFDLGLGILFPFAPSNQCRNKMMNSVAPFWDGNETWLVLGGGGLFAAFPLAYSVIMPAFYIPIILMLLGLIFRGVAFEFRPKAESRTEEKIWDISFFIGSITATFFQGVMLGAFISGFKIENKIFIGTSFDWMSSFSIMTGIALVFGYCLLGATWLIMKTDGVTQNWARKIVFYLTAITTFFTALVSLWSPFLHEEIFHRWFSRPNIFYLLPIPLLTLTTLILLIKSLINKKEIQPFLLTIFLFILCYFGLVISLFPYAIPYHISFKDAAAATTSLSFLLVGVALILSVILCYTAFSYHVFRGKSSHEHMY
jgi:cytochrome d ubiquinol oxidase subunit II